jgi:hypothetical protein
MNDETGSQTDYSEAEKKKISSKKITRDEVSKNFYVDPIQEGEYKPIQHTKEEIDDFNKFLAKVTKDDAFLKGYQKRVPEVFKDAEDFIQPDGSADIISSDVVFKSKRLRELPEAIWDDPLCFTRGKFRASLHRHRYIRESYLPLLPLRCAPIKKRKALTLEQYVTRAKKGGMYPIQIKLIGEDPADQFGLWTLRFKEITLIEHEEEIKKYKEEYENFGNLDDDSLESAIEDRIHVNVILLPHYNIQNNGKPPAVDINDEKQLWKFGCMFFTV